MVNIRRNLFPFLLPQSLTVTTYNKREQLTSQKSQRREQFWFDAVHRLESKQIWIGLFALYEVETSLLKSLPLKMLINKSEY